jgi:hypothetical protein
MEGDSTTPSSLVGGSKTNPKIDGGKEQSIYVKLRSIRIGGVFPRGLSTVKKGLAVETIASQKSTLDHLPSVIKIILQQNHSVIEVILWQNHPVSTPFVKPNQWKSKSLYHTEEHVLQLAITAFPSEKVCPQSYNWP